MFETSSLKKAGNFCNRLLIDSPFNPGQNQLDPSRSVAPLYDVEVPRRFLKPGDSGCNII